jgi:hypothetical protein
MELLSVFLVFTSVKLLCAGGYYVIQRPRRKQIPLPSTAGKFRRRFLRRREVIAANAQLTSKGPEKPDENAEIPPLPVTKACVQSGIKVKQLAEREQRVK